MLIVITNQGGISRGQYTREDVEALHHHLNKLLEKEGAAVDEFYYCPHHSDHEKCLCRKPLPLMIQKAMAQFGIDPKQSWMIGDSQRDMEAGRAAGLKTILVESNGNLEDSGAPMASLKISWALLMDRQLKLRISSGRDPRGNLPRPCTCYCSEPG